MAGTNSSIISNVLSSLKRLSHFMLPSFSLVSSSSSILGKDATIAEVNSIHERLMMDLSRLSRMLQRIQALLHDAEEREVCDKQIQHWLYELREVSYDVEDILDQYDYQVIETQVEEMTTTVETKTSLKMKQEDDNDDIYGYQPSLSSNNSIKIPISCDMAMRIIDIIKKFDEIANDRKALALTTEDAPRRPCLDDVLKRPSSSALVDDSNVFGREDEKRKIIELLMSHSDRENSIIPIVGMGGVGKTTLAQLIYNDPTVCQHFSPKIWVYVSEEFDVLRITKEIITSIVGSSRYNDNNNLNDLQCILKEALSEKRFLLILDDIWNEKPHMWEALQAPFSGNEIGKIIVTTRSMSVACIMQTVPPFELGCLDEEKSWLLFQRYAFCGWELDQQQNFEQIGRGITKKCGRLPLALKVIGGFLRYEVREQVWMDVLCNNLWELERAKDLILPALRISYNHLPTYLKPCFLYASLFPKGHYFTQVELTRMWIAQGYIQLMGTKRLLEDIAFEFFEDLVRRSFFQCTKYDKLFTLHDMVHDLARSITRNETCSLLNFDEMKNINEKAKHIFIQHVMVDRALLFGAIRTFYNVGPFPYSSSIKLYPCTFIKESLSSLGCLRVLVFDAPEFECNIQFTDLIGNLRQLRYLFIHARTIQLAEYSLCSLYKLQTLQLGSFYLNMLPSAIEKLINLRHLVIHCHDIEMLPKSIGQLQNLLTLIIDFFHKDVISYDMENLKSHLNLPHYYSRRDGQHSCIGWLKPLINVRGSLNIYGLQNVVSPEDAKSANLHSKPHIKSLTLSWRNNKVDDECNKREKAILDNLQPHTNLEELTIHGYSGNNFPTWFGNPHFSNLAKVRLIDFNNNEEWRFFPLSGLPSLRSLEITNIEGIWRMGQDFWYHNVPSNGHENYSTDVHVDFHSFEYLKNKGMHEWKEWPTEKNGYFSSLKHLRIFHCQNLELISTLPSNLVEFEVQSCDELEYMALHDSFGPLLGLQKVIITNCRLLKSVKGLNNLLGTLKNLKLCHCYLLHHHQDECNHHSHTSLSCKKDMAYVINCPMMEEWCQWHGFTYGDKDQHGRLLDLVAHVAFEEQLEWDP
ncbi:disease resistance protein RGA2 isoform X1 [Dendrobium catenatum]|uniref:disease resistance protein RGA2 isoform X1 n=2 Tax=Dendrobium catenatum TaxID=906689 RepID=UPI0010A04CBB|nr:disease resistance protein RGA2 isoform X1 [Dendrobium catenatum]